MKIKIFYNLAFAILVSLLTSNVYSQFPGALDLTFNPGTGFTTSGIYSGKWPLLLQPDGKIIAGSYMMNNYNGTAINQLTRINTDGSIDSSFVLSYIYSVIPSVAKLLSNGKIITGDGRSLVSNQQRTVDILNSDGSIDSSFIADISRFYFDTMTMSGLININMIPRDIAIQNDGKFIVAGTYSGYIPPLLINSYLPITATNVSRLNTDGSSDNSFISGTGFRSTNTGWDVASVNKLQIQPDGKIIAGGYFQSYNGSIVYNLARLQSNGVLDPTFNASIVIDSAKIVEEFILLPNGKIVVQYRDRGLAQVGVVRLNADGSRDNSFVVAPYAGPMCLQPNGKIILGVVARLNTDGTYDSTYSVANINFLGIPQATKSDYIPNAILQPDGKLIITGQFEKLNYYYSRPGIARLNVCNSNISVNVSTTNASCPGSSDGSASITINGGIPPFKFYDDIGGLDTIINSNTINYLNKGSGFYKSFYIVDDEGCVGNDFIFNNYYQISLGVGAPSPHYGEQICMLTVDTLSGKNQVVWEKTRGVNTAWFKIYKQNSVTSQYDSIGIVHIDSMSVFTDLGSNPAQQSASYDISVVDSCGNESPLSGLVHTTIHLSANQGINGQVNLQWNAYDGFSYTNFEIYRSNNGSAFTQIGSVVSSSFSYSDLTPPSGTNYYYVAVTKPGGCSPSRSITKTLSNILDGQGNPVTLGIGGVNTNLVKVYPNPSNGIYNLIGDEIKSISLFDALGKEVFIKLNVSNNLIDIFQLPQGIYTLKITLRDSSQTLRLIKE